MTSNIAVHLREYPGAFITCTIAAATAGQKADGFMTHAMADGLLDYLEYCGMTVMRNETVH